MSYTKITEENQAFGRFVCAELSRLGVSTRAFARMCKVDNTALSALKRGRDTAPTRCTTTCRCSTP